LHDEANVCRENVFLWVFKHGESSGTGYESKIANGDSYINK